MKQIELTNISTWASAEIIIDDHHIARCSDGRAVVWHDETDFIRYHVTTSITDSGAYAYSCRDIEGDFLSVEFESSMEMYFQLVEDYREIVALLASAVSSEEE